ncbi:hypothetical protein [Pseudomonas sp.]|uniref:hypothetical protein n=1 Tax=Pseudomonas sp. TaxID=306 RepID=UPI0028ADCD5C|nr:hypothetical protein [Pseudomonas sp.]
MDYDKEQLLGKIGELVGDWFYRDLTADSPASDWLERGEEQAAAVYRIASILTGGPSAPAQSIEEMMQFEIEVLRPAAREKVASQIRPGGEIWQTLHAPKP